MNDHRTESRPPNGLPIVVAGAPLAPGSRPTPSAAGAGVALLPERAGESRWGKLTCKSCGGISMHSEDEDTCDACLHPPREWTRADERAWRDDTMMRDRKADA